MNFRRPLTTGLLAILAGTQLFANVCAGAQTAGPQAGSAQTTADASAQQVAHLEGQNVAEVRVLEDSGKIISQNPADLSLLAGHAYDSEAVKSSLRKLYATGDYADVRAEATEMAGGIRVDFIARRNLFVGVISVEGWVEPPNKSAAYAALGLVVGIPFHESELDEALVRLKETLAQDGLYQAQVQVERTPDLVTRRMNLTVRVTPGPRARIGKITVQNKTPYADAVLVARTKLKPQEIFNSQKLQHADEHLRKFMIKNDYLGSRARLRRGEYDAKTNLLPLILDAFTGLRVRVEVTGAKIPEKEVRKRVPVYEEGAVDPDLLLEGQRALRDYLERQGYFEAQVDYKVSEPASTDEKGASQAEQVITYNVNRGPRQRLVGVSFDGHKYFDNAELRSRLNIQPAAFASPGRFSQRLLEDDVTAVHDLYLANGFLHAVVKSEIEKDHGGKKNDLFVHIHIEEGPQTLVGKLTIEGKLSVNQKELLEVAGSTAGEPYSDFNVATDRDNILALYYNKGFPQAQFTAAVVDLPAASSSGGQKPQTAQADQGHPLVGVTYHIEEGEQVHVTEILIGGYERTRRGVIAREIQVKPGQPLRESDVIETQRRLYSLGIFDRVTLAPQNPTGTDSDKALDVIVEEAKRYTMAYGAGLEVEQLGGSGPDSSALEFSPRVIFEISKANLTGRADTLTFKIRASTLQGRALLSYTQPHYFAKPNLSFQATLFADKSRDVTTFTATRYEGSLQLTQKVSRGTSLVYSYAYRKVLIDAATLRIAPEEIPLFSQPTLVSEFGVSWIREHRDNPADATRGNFNSLDFSLAEKPIGSSASFTRTFFQNSTYYPIGRRFVLARSVRFGVMNALDSTLATDIPLPERFFAGGGESLRGFGLNQAGPRDPVTGFPVGGLAMLVFNQEIRFPMKLPFIGTKLGGAVFYDAGNVFSRLGAITLHDAPSAFSQTSGDLSYFSHTVGFGFRYNTPIGPVRVDLAYQLNPALFYIPCTIGSAGCGANGEELTRLPHFQLFFNLGDIF
jgi:outer membrane protein insertion porin family